MLHTDAPLRNQLWLPFTPSTAMAAHAVMEDDGAETSDGQIVLKTKTFVAGPPNKVVYLNGPANVVAGGKGLCCLAIGRPWWALITTGDGTPAAGESWGPKDDDKLHKDYPGYIVKKAGPLGLALVIREVTCTRCTGLLKGAIAGTGGKTVDNVKAICGLTPVDSLDDELIVQNIHAQVADDNAECRFEWHATRKQWEFYEFHQDGTGTAGLVWAKAQYNWDENAGDPKVSVKRCDRNGTNVVGDAFDVYLPRLRAALTDLDPSVYASDVICYEVDDDGTPICQSPYLWSKIGDFRWQNVLDRIPTGWEEYLPAKHRVLMARDPDGVLGETAIDLTGGFRWHGFTENNHPLHDVHATHDTHADHAAHADHMDHVTHETHPSHPSHWITPSYQAVQYGTGVEVVISISSDLSHDTHSAHSSHSSHGSHTAHSGHDAHTAHDAHSAHTGPYNNEYDTDNRMPWIVEVLIRRTS